MAIGQKLEEARNRKGISIREASESTKIRGDYLSAFEAGQFDIDLPEVYLRGFIRLYSRFLDLDQDAMLSDLDVELGNPSSRTQKKSLGSLTSPESPENSDYSNVSSPPVKPGADIRTGSSFHLGKPVLIVALAVAVVLIVSIVAIVAGVTPLEPDPTQPPQKEGSVTETDTPGSAQNPPVASDTHSLRLVSVGPITRLIIIDEGGGSRNYEYTDLAEGWEQELQFKGSCRLWCSSLENLKFSVDGGADNRIGGSGPGSYALKPGQ
jgi:cytoskeleton protein RodZ